MHDRITYFFKKIRQLIAPERDPSYGMLGPQASQNPVIAYHAEFYLIYLIFYFVPWAFRPPTFIDIIAIIIAIIVFLPIYFRAGARLTPNYIPHMLAMEGIALALIPFHGMSGTFHIYATCQAGFQANKRTSIALIVGLTILWMTTTYLLGRHIAEIGIVAFMGVIVAIGCMASAEQIQHGEKIKRSRELDRQLAAVGERERIARDLHDLLGHTLTMVAVKSEVAEKLIHKDPARAATEIREIREATRNALSDVRRTVAGMIDTSLNTELKQAKKALADANISLEIIGHVPALSEAADKAAGLAIREAVTNIIRHSGATTTVIEFHGDKDDIHITVRDDGHGSPAKEGKGLTGLRQRIESLGGQVFIQSGKGTALTLQFPVHGALI